MRDLGGAVTDWRLTGRYVEACNCDAICPCRRVSGEGGRAQYELCQFALAWTVDDGHFANWTWLAFRR